LGGDLVNKIILTKRLTNLHTWVRMFARSVITLAEKKSADKKTTSGAATKPVAADKDKKTPIIIVLTILCVLLAGGFLFVSMELMNNNNAGTGQVVQLRITARDARDIALEFMGGGTASRILPVEDDGRVFFEVEMEDNEHHYLIIIDGRNGDILSMNRVIDQPELDDETTEPEQPYITSERAIYIARGEVAAHGFDVAFASNGGMQLKQGQWAWVLTFRGEGGQIEFHICVDTGAVIGMEVG